ncbi:hypothetical protein [Patulibacter americanus]|uniref:hypothetical protein n=1 Tax=Patulibacter americanus TaxID=588672 RepID=UPI0003B603D3|nr:hypothetical protein [Patulibacter americanus]
MNTEPHDEHPGDVPPRDPDPETEGGDAGGGTSGEGGDTATDAEDPSSPEAIQNDPSTAGGPSDDVPDEIDRLRGG